MGAEADFDEIVSTVTDDTVEELDGDGIEDAFQDPPELTDSNGSGEGGLTRLRRTKQHVIDNTVSS